MQTFYNFQTKKTVDPLKNIKWFYINPYQPEGNKQLGLKYKLESNTKGPIETKIHITEEGFVVVLFPIAELVDGPCIVKWTEKDKFCVNNSIWCKVVSDLKRNLSGEDIVRVDTIRF